MSIFSSQTPFERRHQEEGDKLDSETAIELPDGGQGVGDFGQRCLPTENLENDTKHRIA